MSYCVHCGVELADYETKCPLCETPVVDPNRLIATGEPTFVDMVDIKEKKFNKHFIIFIISAVMLVPFVVTTIIDITLSLGMTWSAYVLGAEALFWLWFALPFQSSDTSPYVYCLIDGAATALYVLLISVLENSRGWYLPLALPIIAAATLEGLIFILIHRARRIGKLTKVGLGLIALSLLPLVIDIVLAHYKKGTFMPLWSWYAFVPTFALGLAVTLLSRSVRFTEWLRKKMYI